MRSGREHAASLLSELGIVAICLIGRPAGGADHTVFIVFTTYRNSLPVQTMLSMPIPARANADTVTCTCGGPARAPAGARALQARIAMKRNRLTVPDLYPRTDPINTVIADAADAWRPASSHAEAEPR